MNIHDNLFTLVGVSQQKNSRNNHDALHSSLMNHRFIKVSAMSLMCLTALPSFAQPLNCSGGFWNGEAWVCPQDIPGGGNPWGSPNQNGNGHNPGGQNSGGGCWIGDPGCHSNSDGEDHSEPETCSAYEEAQLRARKNEANNCNGDPGPEFDVNEWLADNYWNINSALLNIGVWFNENIWGLTYVGDHNHWLDFFNSELVWLAGELARNNNDIIGLERDLQENLWSKCHDEYSSWPWQTHSALYLSNDEAASCYAASASLMNSYRPGTSLMIDVINFFTGLDISNEDNGENWGGLFNEAVSDHFTCHAIYEAWEEENCSGNL